jgi:hypothetical protein
MKEEEIENLIKREKSLSNSSWRISNFLSGGDGEDLFMGS